MPEQAYLFKFFLIINPGLEEQALQELQRCLSNVKILKKDKGGIEFESELMPGLQLNSVLKIPSRILLRLDEFAASDFPKLFKKMQRLPWEKFVLAGAPLKIEATTESSRLSIKKRIAETAEDAIRKYFKEATPQAKAPAQADAATIAKAKNRLLEKFAKNSQKKKSAREDSSAPPKEIEGQRIFLRFVDNICQLSIDTSGEHLHKRGYRTLIGEAPLRENLASALLMALFEKNMSFREVELIDPMLGSGTFLLEAYNSFLQTSMRRYAYEKWPLVLEKPKILSLQQATNPLHCIQKLSGFDQDAEAIRITEENFKNLRSGQTLAKELPRLSLERKDIFEKEFEMDSDGDPVLKSNSSPYPKFIISNPPYGKRLKVDKKLSDFYTQFFTDCEIHFKPEMAGFLISDDVNLKQIKVPKSWKLTGRLEFRNGGIKVQFLIFKRISTQTQS